MLVRKPVAYARFERVLEKLFQSEIGGQHLIIFMQLQHLRQQALHINQFYNMITILLLSSLHLPSSYLGNLILNLLWNICGRHRENALLTQIRVDCMGQPSLND